MSIMRDRSNPVLLKVPSSMLSPGDLRRGGERLLH